MFIPIRRSALRDELAINAEEPRTVGVTLAPERGTRMAELQNSDGDGLVRAEKPARNNNNNNNNNPICKAPECQKTSVALADRNSRAN